MYSRDEKLNMRWMVGHYVCEQKGWQEKGIEGLVHPKDEKLNRKRSRGGTQLLVS